MWSRTVETAPTVRARELFKTGEFVDCSLWLTHGPEWPNAVVESLKIVLRTVFILLLTESL